MENQRNLIIAIAFSVVVITLYPIIYSYFAPPTPVEEAATASPGAESDTPVAPDATSEEQAVEEAQTSPAEIRARDEVLADVPRVPIDTARVSGSVSLVGGRIDDLVLRDYRESVEPDSPNIILLSPQGSESAYYGEFGWVASGEGTALPTADTVWQSDGTTLTPDQPLTLTWDNGAGLTFTRTVAIDGDFLFTITQSVTNNGAAPVTLYPYGLIARQGTPKTSGFFILHEGLIGVLNGSLKEIDYKDLRNDGDVTIESEGGWLGITDKYWLTALVPTQAQPVSASFRHVMRDNDDRYQTDFRGDAITVAPGETQSSENFFFAGAKEVRLLDRYKRDYGFPLFDRGVDWGWFYFLTKPIFYTLDFIYKYVGNFGIAILLLTVLAKTLFFPLANKSYRAMSKMKALAPQMKKIREQFKEDKLRQQQEMMALYKREKVNPASGCLPILVQIPVFFALYKVLFVTIEMRHAPFFGWIRDLSAPDPTTWVNLFGLLPFDVFKEGWPNLFGLLSFDVGFLSVLDIVSIGVWPLIMGVTMYLQQKLNPTPPDPTQARIMMLLPFVFTFMLGHFAAGLVIYWAWNNTLSITQQRLIMWRMGVKP
jgi:YidC/Oxa1 family membrane protein insertase